MTRRVANGDGLQKRSISGSMADATLETERGDSPKDVDDGVSGGQEHSLSERRRTTPSFKPTGPFAWHQACFLLLARAACFVRMALVRMLPKGNKDETSLRRMKPARSFCSVVAQDAQCGPAQVS